MCGRGRDGSGHRYLGGVVKMVRAGDRGVPGCPVHAQHRADGQDDGEHRQWGST